jgi:hypothetical protein
VDWFFISFPQTLALEETTHAFPSQPEKQKQGIEW